MSWEYTHTLGAEHEPYRNAQLQRACRVCLVVQRMSKQPATLGKKVSLPFPLIFKDEKVGTIIKDSSYKKQLTTNRGRQTFGTQQSLAVDLLLVFEKQNMKNKEVPIGKLSLPTGL